MKVSITKGEWYPVYSVYAFDGDTSERQVEVSEEKYKAWRREFDRFEQLQVKLSKIYDSQKGDEL